MRAPIRFTVHDLDLFPQPLDDTRYEIIDGEIHVSKQPKIWHQVACSRIASALTQWDRASARGLAVPAPGVIFSPEDAVAPDVVWISAERLRGAVDEGGHFRVAPELIVEVLSPGAENERRDRDLKLDLYSRYGVQEYWVVDWERREVAVYRRQGSGLRIVETLRDDATLTSPLLSGFACPIAELWLRTD